MKRFAILLIICLLSFSFIYAQTSLNRYEVEILANPNPGRKDTREVNAVIIFEKDAVKIMSRRKNEVFKELKYKEIEIVEHSFSKNPFFSDTSKSAILTALFGFPLSYNPKEKHWLTIATADNFAILKLENDNYRLIRMEFLIRKLDIIDINEDKS